MKNNDFGNLKRLGIFFFAKKKLFQIFKKLDNPLSISK